MIVNMICVLVLYLTALSLAQQCPQWCEVLSQCVDSTTLCTCCYESYDNYIYIPDNATSIEEVFMQSDYSFCSEDQDCSFYGDCCNASAVGLFSAPHLEWSCTYISATADNYTLMITSCSPQWTDPSTRQKCANVAMLPVTSNTSKVTYSNQYCAICNGERPSDLVFWLQSYTCPDADYTNATAIFELIQMCTFQMFEPPNCAGCVTRPCIPQAIRTCPDGYADDNTARRCKSYSCPIVWGDRVYVNVDCAFCNGAPTSLLDDTCAKNYSSEEAQLYNAIYYNQGLTKKVSTLTPVSLSLLLDVQNSVYVVKRGIGGPITGEAELCKVGQVFVPSTSNMDGYCQNQACLPGEVRVGPNCITTACPASNQSTMRNLTCFVNGNYSCVQLYPNDTHLATIIQHYGPLDQLDDGYIGMIRGGDVYSFNGTLYLCSNFSQYHNTTSMPTDLSVVGLVVLTYVGGSVSIVGCSVLLITYSLFRELRTLPGKLLMNLAVAILASDVTLVGLLTLSGYIVSQKYCISVAIILHFTFLSRFSWMSVLAFHLLAVFSAKPFSFHYSSKIHKLQIEKKVFLYAFALGWLLPLSIVVICISLNFSTDLIGYGENDRCWIARRGALIGGFIVPTYVSVLFNSVSFVVVCWSIFRSTTRTQKALTRARKSGVRVYISLGVLMGLTWPSGFIAMSVNSIVPWYFFVALNSIQGLLLSVVFVCTKKNANLCRSLHRGKVHGGKVHQGILSGTSTTSLAHIKPDNI